MNASRLRPGIAIGLTLALHLLAWWALRAPPRPAREPSAPRVAMRLIREPAAAPRSPAPASLQHEVPRTPRGPLPITPRPAPSMTQRDTAAQPATQRMAPVPPEEPPAADSTARPPLDIGLAPYRAASATPSMRDQAMSDPRANTPPLSRSERFARRLGSVEALSEQAMGDGHVIVRQGTDCYDVRVARNADIDAFSQANRPTPRLATGCGER
ncbi:MAG TPA: hypothetical protein VKI18_15950 [Albitalea sp.]|nr:hypothetical protein [Albitalea sp.]